MQVLTKLFLQTDFALAKSKFAVAMPAIFKIYQRGVYVLWYETSNLSKKRCEINISNERAGTSDVQIKWIYIEKIVRKDDWVYNG